MATNLFSGVKNVQSDWTSGAGLSTSTGEDVRYRDITITAVADINKCVCRFDGGAGTTDAVAMYKSEDGTAGLSYLCTVRLTSTTNLRVSTVGAVSNIAGRWTVVEYD